MSQVINSLDNEYDEELDIDFKKIFKILQANWLKLTIIFLSVFIFIVSSTFFSKKLYTVNASLYINKTNNSNLSDINPFVISEMGGVGGLSSLASKGTNLQNEIALMKSAIILDKVIKENDLKIGKLYGIFETKKTGDYFNSDVLAKIIKIDTVKNSQIINIKYTSAKKEVSYNVVNSLINNYQKTIKDLNIEKAKKDTKMLTKEYNEVKKRLTTKFNKSELYPDSALSSGTDFMAMSAFSKSAGKAFGNITGKFKASQKSQLELEEEKAKLEALATRLEYAKLIEKMSEDATKVLVVKAPKMPKEHEYSSPKLFKNIILGIILGIIANLLFLLFNENNSKKLTYTRLGNNIIYKDKELVENVRNALLTNRNDNVILISFTDTKDLLKEAGLKKKSLLYDGNTLNEKLFDGIDDADKVILLATIGKTSSLKFLTVKNYINKAGKEIISEVLV